MAEVGQAVGKFRLRVVGVCSGLIAAAVLIAITVPASANIIDLPDTTGDVGLYPSVALKPNGFATIAYFDQTNGDLKVRNCTDSSCEPGTGTTQTLNTAADIGNNVGLRPSMVLEPGTGYPVISYFDLTNGALRLARCNDIGCASASLTTVDDGGAGPFDFAGSHSSLQLDSAGRPVIAYTSVSISGPILDPVFEREVRIVRCDDLLCAPGGDSINVVGTTGSHPSLRLSAGDLPVVVTSRGFLGVEIVSCADMACTTMTTEWPLFATEVDGPASIELDSSGHPVVAFQRSTDGSLGFLHCNDAACAGDDESITYPDGSGDVGQGVSLKLDSDGNPVMSYYRFDGLANEVRVLRCLDPNCAGGGYVFARPLDADPALNGEPEATTSLALDASDLPVIGTYEPSHDDLRLIRCEDRSCPRTFFVDHTAVLGDQTGETWEDAFLNPVQAIAAAQQGEVIRIAAGTYRPGGPGQRSNSFEFAGLTVVGGYDSGGSDVPNPVANATVLSGDLSSNDASAEPGDPTRSDNSYHVVRISPAVVPALLSNLFVVGGNADGTADDGKGGGLVVASDAVLESVTVGANTAALSAGLHVRDGAHLEVRDSSIRDNASSNSGAGIGIDAAASADLISVLLAANTAGGVGGGMNNLGDAAIVRSTIAANEASFGGGVSNVGMVDISNSLFTLNSSTNDGGAIWDVGTGTLTNLTLADNSADGTGDAIHGVANTTMFNSIVWDVGVTPLSGAGMFVNYSVVQNGYPGTGNTSADPQFVNAAALNFRLSDGSPAIDAGFNLNVPADVFDVDADNDFSEPAPDLDLNQRISGSVVDIGAYEFDQVADGLALLGGECAVYDSSLASDTSLSGLMSGGDVRTVQVAGALAGQGGAPNCIPVGATSVIFRISAVGALTEGNLRMTPAGVVATGGAGVVNYGAANGLDNANTVTVPLSAGGAVDIQANAGPAGTVPTAGVRLVVIGYYSPDTDPDLKYFALNPCAAADSRTNKGAGDSFDGPADNGLWPVGSNFPDVDVVGDFPASQGGGNTDCGVPTDASAVMVNVVAVNMAGGSGHLSVGEGGTDPIDEATTPFAVLSPKMNNGATTILPLSTDGTIAIDIDGDVGAATMIRVEVLGYYAEDSAGLDFFDVAPCTVFDSRPTKGANGSFAGQRAHGLDFATTYQLTGSTIPVAQGGVVDNGAGVGTCGVPAGASAVLMNLEAVNALVEGNFWVSAAGTTTSGGVLNFNNLNPKMNNANTVVVPLSASGEITLEVNAGSFTADGTAVAHARGIVFGYFN